ncbi:MAG: ATP-dependent helicase [Bacteroidales bacterium]|nr:ATP-dependent helicase [Bacteroidales bacterium]MCF8458925.1 ATP-dependent helicase [Bacteroidales bacterium]
MDYSNDFEKPPEFDQEKLIADFMSDFSMLDSIDVPKQNSFDDFDEMSIESYEPVEIDDTTEDKIKQLQALTKSIEQKSNIDYKKHYAQISSEYKIDYKASLNPNQYYAVTNTDLPLLVIAGAGSGKTRTIVYRVSYLLEKGVDPSSILLLTFTRKAAKEMINRTTELLGNNDAEKIVGGTFHAFANYALRRYANLINVPANFNIIDTIDAEDIVALIRDELVKDKSRAFPKKKRIYEIISKSKNCNLSIGDIIEREFTGLVDYQKDIELIATAYHQYKAGNRILDYDDLLETMRDRLRDYPLFRKRMQEKYSYVMVDEYQDTNLFQADIVNFIAEKHRHVMVVGDDSQSIYAFRGANFENILRFPAAFPDGEVVKIEQNYRSNQSILDFSNSIITHAKLGYRKKLFSENKNIVIPQFQKFYDQEGEARFIVSKILEMREKNIPLSEMAVLYRASFHGNFIQAELLKRSIPYIVVGGIKFTERRHIRDIIAFLRIIVNPFDASAWNRVLKLLPGIGDVTAKKIILEIRRNNGELSTSSFAGKQFGKSLEDLRQVLQKAGEVATSVAGKVELLRNFYSPLLKTLEDDYENRNLDIDVIYSLAGGYDNLQKFLSDFALDPPSNQFQDKTSPLISEVEEDPLVLSTIHSAKGLEWHVVFVPHMLDGLFPSSRAMKNITDMEEERRLFYVACTRAKEELYLSMPSYFSTWDKMLTKPSRFIAEIDKEKYRYEK